MGLFKDLLKDDESLFQDSVALDYDFIPKQVPYREEEQHYIASCIKPLMQQRNGKNLILVGPSGVGKTVLVKHLFKELEDETDDVVPIYVNCWQHDTSYKIVLKICDTIGYKFTQNKKTEELFRVVRDILNKKAAVFSFDEVDKAKDNDFIYFILEEIYRKTLLLITNHKEWVASLDSRIRSRLVPELLEFEKYNAAETDGILKERQKYAFVLGVWKEEAFDAIVNKTAQIGDIRTGLFLMREAGNLAELRASRTINVQDAEKAMSKLSDFAVKDEDQLDEDAQKILAIIRQGQEKKIGDLFKEYQDQGGNAVYKTFQRKIKRLEEAGFIVAEKTGGGAEGSTTLVKPRNVAKDTKIGDF